MNLINNPEKHKLITLAFIGALFPTAISAQTFEIVDLGTLGGLSAGANSIADDGPVAGWAASTLEQRTPFLRECAECPMLSLGFLPYGSDGSAIAISKNASYVAGYSGITFAWGSPNAEDPPILGTEVPQAFMWHDGVMHELGALYNPAFVNRRHGHSEAHGVNDHGQVVGFSIIHRAGAYHAFLWENGVMRDITPDPVSADITRAFDINNKSQVVGDAAAATALTVSWPTRSAFLWQADTTQDLGMLDGHTASSARAINEHTQIVGWSGVTESDYSDLLWSHAVLWDNGTIKNLGTLSGDESSQALAINDRRVITGWSGSTDQGVSRAFLWQCEQMQDLNTLITPDTGWHLSEARAINNAGLIVGVGFKDGEPRGYRLRPLSAAPGDCEAEQRPGRGRGVTDNPGRGRGPIENPGQRRGPAETPNGNN